MKDMKKTINNRPQFGDLRTIIDKTAKIQICEHKTGNYTDYRFIEDVSHDYDSREVYGIGLVRSELKEKGVLDTGRYAYAIEIRLV